MIIMLDADTAVIKAKDMIKGANQTERVERSRNGDYAFSGNGKALAERDNKPINRVTFIGHSAYEVDTNVQCYGGWAVDDFADLLISRLKEANKATGRKRGFTDNVTTIDLIGCFTGYVDPTGKSFAGRVAERLLVAGFDIQVNAFTNRHLPHPHAISSMSTLPSTEEGKLYIRGFTSPVKHKKYSDMKVVCARLTDERDFKSCALAEIKEKIIALDNKRAELEKLHGVARDKMDAIQKEYMGLKKEVDILEEKSKSHQNSEFSFPALNKAVKSVLEEARKSNSKWKSTVESLFQDIEKINASQISEKEKINGSMQEIEKTIKKIRSNFFSGRRSSTANALQDLMDNKENTHSFDSLKNLLNTINKDAANRGSKWQNKTDDLISKIEKIDKLSCSDQEKLKEAFALINHMAKNIRGHFFGGSGSTVADRLEKILEKQPFYFTYAAAQDELKYLSQKTMELDKFRDNPRIKKLKKEHNQLKQELSTVDTQLNRLNEQEEKMKWAISGVNNQLEAAKNKMESYAIEIACTDYVREYLDTHAECNFTQPVKDKQSKMRHIMRESRKASFFNSDSKTTDITPTTFPSLGCFK